MKLVSIALFSSLTFISIDSSASNNTYIYSNAEYCELAVGSSSEAHLEAYSRKLGFKPTATECRQLMAETEIETVAADQNVKQLLRETLRGSTIRPSTALNRKISSLSKNDRQQALNQLFGR